MFDILETFQTEYLLNQKEGPRIIESRRPLMTKPALGTKSCDVSPVNFREGDRRGRGPKSVSDPVLSPWSLVTLVRPILVLSVGTSFGRGGY